jgi:hypothetical protein
MYDHLGSPPVIDGVGAAHQFSVLCCVVFLIRPVSCVPNVASVSGLFIPFLIAQTDELVLVQNSLYNTRRDVKGDNCNRLSDLLTKKTNYYIVNYTLFV